MKRHLEEYVFPMIRKMTAIPASAKNSFGTATANMERAIVRVVEGESTLPRNARRWEFATSSCRRFFPKARPSNLPIEYNANQVLEVAVDGGGQHCESLDPTQHRRGAG